MGDTPVGMVGSMTGCCGISEGTGDAAGGAEIGVVGAPKQRVARFSTNSTRFRVESEKNWWQK